MWRELFKKNSGAIFSLAGSASTFLRAAQRFTTSKMSMVTISGMDVHGVTNITGQIQVQGQDGDFILYFYFEISFCPQSFSLYLISVLFLPRDRSSLVQCFPEKREFVFLDVLIDISMEPFPSRGQNLCCDFSFFSQQN